MPFSCAKKVKQRNAEIIREKAPSTKKQQLRSKYQGDEVRAKASTKIQLNEVLKSKCKKIASNGGHNRQSAQSASATKFRKKQLEKVLPLRGWSRASISEQRRGKRATRSERWRNENCFSSYCCWRQTHFEWNPPVKMEKSDFFQWNKILPWKKLASEHKRHCQNSR